MISNEQQDVVANTGGKRRSKRVGLAEFDGQRLAVILRKERQETVLRGTAVFVRDDRVGNSLQIVLGDDVTGKPVLILSEDEWNGRIIPDFHHGCDFCLVIS